MSKDGKNLEEEYFKRQEAEQIKKLKAKVEAEQAAKAAEELKALHYLHCGKCGTKMDTKIFKGVEIDVCGSCGAVLLDNGELETLVGKDESGAFRIFHDLFRFTKEKDIG